MEDPHCGWFIVENPTKMDDLGYPISGNLSCSGMSRDHLEYICKKQDEVCIFFGQTWDWDQ